MFFGKTLTAPNKDGEFGGGDACRKLEGEEEALPSAPDFGNDVADAAFDGCIIEEGGGTARIARRREDFLPDVGVVESDSTCDAVGEMVEGVLGTEGEIVSAVVLAPNIVRRIKDLVGDGSPEDLMALGRHEGCFVELFEGDGSVRVENLLVPKLEGVITRVEAEGRSGAVLESDYASASGLGGNIAPTESGGFGGPAGFLGAISLRL